MPVKTVEEEAPQPGRKRFVQHAFGAEIVDIDAAEFLECEFRGTILRYRGGELPHLMRCTFSDTQFTMDGAAARTLAFLKAMASPGSGLQRVVRETFASVFGH